MCFWLDICELWPNGKEINININIKINGTDGDKDDTNNMASFLSSRTFIISGSKNSPAPLATCYNAPFLQVPEKIPTSSSETFVIHLLHAI